MVTLQMAQMGGFDVIVKVLTTTLPGVVRINRVQNMHGYDEDTCSHSHMQPHIRMHRNTHSQWCASSVCLPSQLDRPPPGCS